jgi:hypothetical protein
MPGLPSYSGTVDPTLTSFQRPSTDGPSALYAFFMRQVKVLTRPWRTIRYAAKVAAGLALNNHHLE